MTTTAEKTIAAAWGLFAALLLLMVGNGLTGVLIGVRSELEAFNTATTGVIMASYFAGFLVGSQVTPRIMARVGHIRVFAGLSSFVAVSALLHAVWVTPALWTLLRLVFGFAMAGLYVVVESWLNEMVTNVNRGRVMATYMVVAMGGLGLGQILLGAGDPLQQNLFILAGALVALSVAPLSLSINTAPEFLPPPPLKAMEIWRAAPVGVVTALGAGIANGALIGMAGVYATQVGLPNSRTALFVGAAALGSVLLQWPIGHMSDLMDRRKAILIVTLVATAAGVAGLAVPTTGLAPVLVMLLLGGFSFPMYSLALSHVVDVLPPGRAVNGSMAVIFVTGVGAILGPVAASVAMILIGPPGFFWSIVAVHGAIGLYGLIRITRRPVIEGLTPEPYLPVPARSTFIPRRIRNGKKQTGDMPRS